jgi:hypothetical protein
MHAGCNDEGKPGAVLRLLGELRAKVGTLKAKKKEGVKFKVRSLDELVDRVRPAATELGLLIYPVGAAGQGHVVEDGTLAECNLTVRIQAVEDGSYIDVAGFGLGADSQDKAGGKAGSYAFKQALIQTLLAGGAEDTDDTDTPIKGGVRKKTGRPSQVQVEEALKAATTKADYDAAVVLAKQLPAEAQLALMDTVRAAKARCTDAAAA